MDKKAAGNEALIFLGIAIVRKKKMSSFLIQFRTKKWNKLIQLIRDRFFQKLFQADPR